MKKLALMIILSASILLGCNKEEEKAVINEVGAGIDIESIAGWWYVKPLNPDQKVFASIYIAPVDESPGLGFENFNITDLGVTVYMGDSAWEAYIATKEGDIITFKDKKTGATIITIKDFNKTTENAKITYYNGEVTNTFSKLK